MRFGIVGCGGMGRVHAAVIASLGERAQLSATVGSRLASAEDLARDHGATAFPSLEAALADNAVDAIVVCTPSGAHADPAVAALRSGRHVIIEKPLDVTLSAAHRVRAAARESTAVATVVSQHRFDPAGVAVQRAIAAGGLGRITSGLASIALWRPQAYYDSAPWRRSGALDGGGVLMNQAIHQIDVLIWLMGRPDSVFADTATLAHDAVDVEDTAVATLRFGNGALATVHATTGAYPGTSTRVQIHGTHGSAIIEGDRLVSLHTAGAVGLPSDDGRGARNRAGEFLPDGGDPGSNIEALARQYVDFLDAIEGGRAPRVTLVDAMLTLAVVEAFYESSRTGRPARISEHREVGVRMPGQNPPRTEPAIGSPPPFSSGRPAPGGAW